MLCRLTYALERLHDSSRLPGVDLAGRIWVRVFHLSTPDHLALLLEQLLTASPGVRVQVVTHSAGLDSAGELAVLAVRFNVEICRWNDQFRHDQLDDHFSSFEGYPDLALQLFSLIVRVSSREARSMRRAFSRAPAWEKLIVHGHNGSVWKGDAGPRLGRFLLRVLLERLRPVRNGIERRLIARRLVPDPGWDPQNPPAVNEFPGSTARRRLILRQPVRVEQCPVTGNAVKPGLLRDGAGEELYEGRYHFSDLYDRRRDWQALLERYQSRRWRNMTKLGMESARGNGARPTALDIGCGTGGLAGRLAAEGYAVTGVDCSRTSIAKAQLTFPEVEFRVVPFEELETLEERFDLITLSHVVEHARDDAALLRTAAGLLVPGGKLYVEVPWLDPDPLQARPFWYRQTDHYREYTKLGLYLLVAGAGLRVLAHGDSWHEPEGREPYQFLLAIAPAAGE